MEEIPPALRAYHRFICPQCEQVVKAMPSRINSVDGVVLPAFNTRCPDCKVLTQIHLEGMDTHYRKAMEEHFRILAEQAAAAEAQAAEEHKEEQPSES